MAKGLIYMVDAGGALTAMAPSAPRNEDSMQALVARHPELISDEDGDLLLVRREQPIADSIDGAGRWSVDHLFVTQTSVPVLVELKRAADPRLRREVVGQMLDYAANATAHWQAGRIADAFAKTATADGREPDLMLADFLGEGIDPGKFWSQVDDNFRSGRIKIVFVADVIPNELARIVEFLNDQMRADVRAVELRWFESAATGVTALSPRIIGDTERGIAAKAARNAPPAIECDEWIAMRLAPFGQPAVAGANQFVDLVRVLGGRAEPSVAQASIIASFEARGKTIYPMFLVGTGGGQVQLALGYLKNREPFKSEESRQTLLDRLTAIVGPLTQRPLHGFPAFPVSALTDAAIVRDVTEFLRELIVQSRG
ncbi:MULTISPECIES: hypothetical protein [Sphingosinicellaceae]|uniref:hypothetical protein n=1 Tax=Sphingosinicellaceae TaxID=2820280 RepID=UPI001C1DED71|nr:MULTISPECIES: hypothetical protein [Polymorphobacter]QYE34856.1 hypothetical protein KZX46_19320 [Polymorphobacter sp. PAMC 29334]UAJ11792.1 hypothetical protein KTC28_09100 [Polymorphobacter megasporae]